MFTFSTCCIVLCLLYLYTALENIMSSPDARRQPDSKTYVAVLLNLYS